MSVEQRQYYRRTISEEVPTAVLTHGRSRIQCWLVEMSLGGFAVLVPSELKTAATSLARLQVQDLEYIVRITRQESLGDCVLVGMEQIEEVLPNTTLIPASLLSQRLTFAAWIVAIGTSAAAGYFLSGWYPDLPPWPNWR